jgi:ADP-heptose:LPS heptosyltransferase
MFRPAERITAMQSGFRARLRRLLRRALSQIKDDLRFHAFSAHDRLACNFVRHPAQRRDTLVLRTDGLGDLVLWLDAAKEVPRIAALTGRLILLTRTPNEELADALPQFAEIWAIDVPRFVDDLAYRRRLLRKVAGYGFEVAFNALLSRDALIDDAILRAAGARRRIGAEGDFANSRPHHQRITNRWYTELRRAPRADRMELQRSRDFLALLGAGYETGAPVLAGDFPNPTGQAPGSYYVLFPGAGFEGKGWSPGRWQALAAQIFEESGLRGIVCGGRAERAVASELAQNAPEGIESWAGKTSVPELIGIIRQARFVVGNDTSAAHIAAAVKVPAVAILGGGHFGRFLPYAADRPTPFAPTPIFHAMPCFHCGWSCIFPLKGKIFPCVDAVSVDQVWQAVRPFLIEGGAGATAARAAAVRAR